MANIALTLTYRCPLKCRICLIEAGPDRKGDMSLDEALSYLEQLQTLDTGTIALTGGEPFLVYDLLLKTLQQATKLGLVTSTGTSAYWAKTKEGAHELLEPLRTYGLNGISFSADEWHQEFVPLEYVKNGIEAAREIGFKKVGLQTTITPRGEHMKTTVSKLKSMGCDLSEVFFVETPATISGRAATHIPPAQFLYFFKAEEMKIPCRFVGTILAIMPDGWVYPCCNAYPAGLIVGNAKYQSLREIVETLENNPLIQMLSRSGINELARTVKEHNLGYEFREKYASICHLCYDILRDRKLTERIYSTLGITDMPWNVG
jgi:MoaA/NifB/PqqE/SkfB family radical SAM enzyme